MFVVTRTIKADLGCLKFHAIQGYYVHWNDLQPFEEFEQFGNSEQLERWSVTHVMAWRRGRKLDPKSAMEAVSHWIPGPLMPILSVQELSP